MLLVVIRVPLYTICCLSCLLATLALAGCGDPKSTGDRVVARVDDQRISLAELNHWTDVEAVLAYETTPKKPVPAGVIPDPPSYAKCIDYSKTSTGLGHEPAQKTTGQLKQQCEARREQLLRHVLDILITATWLRGEAAGQGVKVSPTEIEQVRRRIFPTEAPYRRYLTLTGQTPADERLIIEKDLLDTKLLQRAEANSERGTKTPRQHEQLLIKAATAFTKKWQARTSCSAGYVVSECKQYKGPLSLVAP